MEQRFTLSRPNTVSLEIPDLNGSRNNYARVATEAVANYGRSGFHCLQARGMKSFLISFKGQIQAIQAIEDGFKFESSVLPLQAVTSGTTWINITELPFELPDSRISRALAFYGNVKRVEHVKVDPKIGDFYTGDRKVLLDMKKRVPNILSIDGHEAVLWYKDVARLCRRCGREGHNAADCSIPAHRPKKCANCGNRWHDIDNCSGCMSCHTEAHTPETCPEKISPKTEPADEPQYTETTVPPIIPIVSPNQENTPVSNTSTGFPPTTVPPPPPPSEVETIIVTDSQMECCEEPQLPSSDSSLSSDISSEPASSPSPTPSHSTDFSPSTDCSAKSDFTSVETAATALYKHRTPTSSWKNRNFRALSSVQEENILKYRFEPIIISMVLRMDKKVRNQFIRNHAITVREAKEASSKRFHPCPPSPPSTGH